MAWGKATRLISGLSMAAAMGAVMVPSTMVWAASGNQTNQASPSWAAGLYVNGQEVATGDKLVYHGTTWLPASDVEKVLAALNLPHSSQPGQWKIGDRSVVLPSLQVSASTGSAGSSSGSVQSGTSFVPIWYVMQALKADGYKSSWTGATWRLEGLVKMVPASDSVIQKITAATKESGTDEHFNTGGQKPVTTPDGQGGTFTAITGMRFPTADGLGQIVFFFHGDTFIGVNANVEATLVRSIKAAGPGSFAVTYSNYAPDDPMVNPTLPPATITYTWNGTKMVPSASLPKGVTNGLQVVTP